MAGNLHISPNFHADKGLRQIIAALLAGGLFVVTQLVDQNQTLSAVNVTLINQAKTVLNGTDARCE